MFAFGSPEGLSNSVSTGVVSSVARQPDPDTPFICIQTDAPINPGNSGGLLVNAKGEIVGLDTFILTQSGGSEGISFAIPALLIRFVATQLRKYGHVHRVLIGAGVQTITSTLAAGLNLSRESGVIVSDVFPGVPAEASGVKLNDIVLTVDGRAIQNLPMFMMSLLENNEGQHVKLDVLRQGVKVSIDVVARSEAPSGNGAAFPHQRGPVERSNFQEYSGQISAVPPTHPSASEPPKCGQLACTANTSPARGKFVRRPQPCHRPLSALQISRGFKRETATSTTSWYKYDILFWAIAL